VLDVVRAHADGPLADAVALDLYQRKALRQLRPSRYLNYPEPRRREWVRAIAGLARAHVPAHVEDRLRRRFRLRSRLARAGDLRALEALLRVQEHDGALPVVVSGGRVLLDLPHDGEPLDLTPTRACTRASPPSASGGTTWTCRARCGCAACAPSASRCV
jgi:hypothetical protein